MQPKSIILFFYGYILFFRRQLYMKNPNIKEEKALEENIELAKSFDAEIISVYDDIARQIAEYSSLSNVSKIVLGKNKDKKV